ncbi:MAG: hypothetical protein SVU32_03100 [Candidatus Nanohaloarchaea archaeon]|nr:hypothetical protein [Candidatus Nanohaloarchaea archaeon]
MFLGVFDLIAGIVFTFGETGLPGWFITFIVGFLLLKGVTTVIQFPIWFGPLGFFAGMIDLTAGAIMYFGHSYTGFLVSASSVLAVFLMMKGGFTVIFGLVTT